MIPKLYGPDRVSLLTHLSDATVCEVTEERNGIFELLLEIPTASEQYPHIVNDCWIKAKPSENGNDQFFRVYDVEKSMPGLAVVRAEHISYLLSAYPVDSVDLTGVTATAAINFVLDRAAALLPSHHGFSGISDVQRVLNFSVSAVSARAALGGTEGSVLRHFNGEYEFDNKIVRLYRARGADHGVKIEYAKNLLALKASISTENSFTGLFPFVKNEDSLLLLPERILWVNNNSGVQTRVLVRDFGLDAGENPTEASLRAAAREYLSSNHINDPSISMDVDFVHLWQSPEYEEFKDLERVALCDIVTVRHPDLGVDVSAKVVRTVYDTLRERYKKITIGSARSNMAAVLAGVRAEIDSIKPPDFSDIQQIIQNVVDDATNAITGNSGGRVILNPALNPQEILILTDLNDSIQTAQRLWRFNAAGLGYSSNGYNGPYGLALTADGQINADAITTGVVNANLIRAGILSSADGISWINLEDGKFSFANGGLFWDGDSLMVSSSNASPFAVRLDNEMMSFLENGIATAYFGNNRFHITDGEISRSLYFKNWAFIPKTNGNLSLAWMGGI